MLRALLLALFSATVSQASDTWQFHFEAAKGETKVTIPREPRPLEKLIFEPLTYSPDPLTAGVVISGARIRQLGTVAGHAIFEVRSTIRDDYYTDLYLLLVEITPSRFLPIYADQFYGASDEAVKLSGFGFREREAWLQTRHEYGGNGRMVAVFESVVECAS